MPFVLLAAGGTGGHLFPAEALAEALDRRGVGAALATDDRAERYGKTFPARGIYIITSATVRGRNPLSLVRTAVMLGIGTLQCLRLLARTRPSAVVGFGGYPTIPPVLAATLRNVPSLIHEQNAVMGRANRFLAPRVDA
ncbi:MAG TPA: glycosyltransferase, partial [Xanthobacteraceae bacterium]|nr:glycosyltransferase [Xanthobacteraceae bacterium]